MTESGKLIGGHDGLMFHTIGQRKGLNIGGSNSDRSEPWYVIDKNINTNELIVGQGNNHPLLYKKYVTISNVHWINGTKPVLNNNLKAKIRYRANDYSCKIISEDNDEMTIEFKKKQFAVANGQSLVFYDNQTCLGGATINSSF